MKYLDRALLLIQATGGTLVSLLFLLLAFGWLAPLGYLRTSLQDIYGRALIAVLSSLFLVVSLRLLLYNTGRMPAKQAVVHETTLGQIKVSLHAVENLVKKVARQIKGVRDVKAYVFTNKTNDIEVQLRAVVSPEISIPAVAAEIQQTVKEYILDVVGVSVASVKVYIENISAEAKTRVE